MGAYIREGLNFKERKDLENYKIKTFENLVFEVLYPNKSLIISNIYRSPTPPRNTPISDHMTSFLDTLDTHLSNLSELNKPSYIFTDSNINLLRLHDTQICSDYLDTLITNGFIQLICKATRIQSHNTSLIDHIITNTNLKHYTCGTIVDDISDHFINYIQITIDKPHKQKINTETKRQINETNTINLKNALRLTDWSDITADNNVDTSFNKFWEKFNALYNTHFPVITTRFNRNKHKINGYMNDELLEMRNIKTTLHKKSILTRDTDDINNYRIHRNNYNTALRQSKQKYYTENLNLNTKNSKRTWELLKEAANLNKTKTTIDKINKNDNIITNPVDIANEFNDFFTTIGVKIAENIKPSIAKPEDFMPQLDNLENLDLGTTSQTHICDIIKSLQPKNSCDVDGISTKLLKALAIEISSPLSHIFNLSLKDGIFPSRLKSSRTVPVFKSGNPDLCDNYRPIALLSTLSKILEKIVCVQLINHLNRNNILYEHQYGFQRNKSTKHNIIHALNHISKALNENKYCIGVFFDLKKAFDVCSHKILLMKLNKMGIRGTALEWFKSYLADRTQIVDINGSHSRSRKIKISILQGSILGPILFLCFINDLHHVTSLLTLMFADDTFTLKSNNNLNNLIHEVNAEINKIAIWFRANKLAVNINKTKYMIFRMKGKPLNINMPDLVYNENEPNQLSDNSLITTLERYHDNHPLKEGRAYKLLGIYLDEHLTLNSHVNHIVSKLTKSLYCIKQTKHILTLKGLKALYFSLIHSHLTYCTSIMSLITAKNLNRILKIQKKAIRIITNSTYTAHTNPLYCKHKILPYNLLIKQAQLIFMHSIEHNYSPTSFTNTWQKNTNREHDLRNAQDFQLIQPRTESF